MTAQLILGLGTVGCTAIPDPSASVVREMSDDHCRDFLFHPDVDLIGITKPNWFWAPTFWDPACPPLGGERTRWRPMAPVSAVFTLPQVPPSSVEPTKVKPGQEGSPTLFRSLDGEELELPPPLPVPVDVLRDE
ncbi:hypothetical protein SH661x_003176 [Planctomicrobium sp. SH661]|uniref:hypothetical protein n=1 Tax=Planctomicrobium sp. SH661 TaxID=3448124 RepID=UPI003F5B0571